MNGSTPHEVGGVAAQALPLVQGLVDEADLALLEVAKAAVDQLGALRRRARGEVVALDERGAQPAAGGVEGDADAGDAAADHHHVEGLVGQAAQHRGAVERRTSAGELIAWSVSTPRHHPVVSRSASSRASVVHSPVCGW